jgi:hypothetical protein
LGSITSISGKAVPVPPCFFQSVLFFFFVGNFFLAVVRKVVLAVGLVVGGGLGEVPSLLQDGVS